MSRSINLVNSLNESFETELKAKRTLKESEETNAAYLVAEFIALQIEDRDSITFDEFTDLLEKGIDEAMLDNSYKNERLNDFESTVRGILDMNYGLATVFEGENEGGLERTKAEDLTESPKLDARFDSRQSFYGKAKTEGDKLYSYNTLVAEMKEGKPVVYGLYSQTTTRHIKEWLKQNGFKAESSKQIMNDYGVKEEAAPQPELSGKTTGTNDATPEATEEPSRETIKGLLDSGAIDDYDYYSNLSDEEKEELIDYWTEHYNDDLKEAVRPLYKDIKAKLEEGVITGPKDYNKLTESGKNKLIKYWIKNFKESEDSKKENKLEEDEVVVLPDNEEEVDYIITDVTVLTQVGDGDVQAPDIDALLTLVNESLKESYGDTWGHINVLSSRVNENDSFALVDISTPEIIKEFEDLGIVDAAVGKNLILENKGSLVEFKVNSLNGLTKFSKTTSNPVATIKEWIETEFLHEAMKQKAEMEELEKVKKQKEVTEEYINSRPELKQEIENIKMFIELGKQVKASEEMKPAIQKRMYAFATELPFNTEITNKDDKYELKFNTVDDMVEIVFGKEWVEEKEEIPEVVELQESYSQFNIGDIEVVFNPETYECLYSIPSADVKDKKINLSKIPSVDTPYDTNTIIKTYVETKFGVIPDEATLKANKEMEKAQPTETVPTQTEVVPSQEQPLPQEGDLQEDELPEEPEGEEPVPQEEVPEAETGSAPFIKIRPKQNISLVDVREKLLDNETPASNYIVVDTIDLPEEEWNNLTNNLNQQQTYLSDIKSMDRKNYSFNVVKITSSAANYALLVDPLGYNYPRYVGIEEGGIQ